MSAVRDAISDTLSFANTYFESLGGIRDPLAKDINHVGDWTLGILTLPSGRSPSGFAMDGRDARRLLGLVTVRSVVQRADDAGLCRLANVAMMQAADFWQLYDPTRRGKLNR